MLRPSIEDTVLVRQTICPTASGKDEKIGPLFLLEDSMADYLGVVSLQVTLTSEIGVWSRESWHRCFWNPLTRTTIAGFWRC